MIEQQICFQVDERAKLMWEEIRNDNPECTRRVEVRRSMWWSVQNPNYCVLFFIGNTLFGCENGLTRTAAIKSVKAWENRNGWMN